MTCRIRRGVPGRWTGRLTRLVVDRSGGAVVVSVAMLMTAGCSDGATRPEPTEPTPVVAVKVAPAQIEMDIGQTRQLAASPVDADGRILTRAVTWSSSAADVATVDGTGTVHAIAAGTATITARSEGREGSATVTIAAAPIELAIGKTTMAFEARAGVSDPPPQSTAITATHGIATGLSTVIRYGTGEPAGWLTATYSTTATPATLEIAAVAGTLPAGSYTARVEVRATNVEFVQSHGIDVLLVVKPGPETMVSASDRHSCGLSRTGIVSCWGYNGSRQLGVGSMNAYEPNAIALPGGLRFIALSTGELHACGITIDGRAFCWGSGYMGNGPASPAQPPREVAGGRSWTAIAAGYRHSCGIAIDGDTYCWGQNGGGAVGNGTRVDQPVPVRVPGGHRFVGITAGEDHTCGWTSAGEGWCWGRTAYGRLGAGPSSTDAEVAPVRIGGNHAWAALEAGRYSTCGITTAGDAYCWGYNGSGQLGDDTRTHRSAPTPVAGGIRFAAISTGNVHTCAVTPQGQAYCWGYRTHGPVGDGSNAGYALTPVAVSSAAVFRGITAGSMHSCGVSTTDEVYCWGYNANGAVGDGTVVDRLVPVRTLIEQ